MDAESVISRLYAPYTKTPVPSDRSAVKERWKSTVFTRYLELIPISNQLIDSELVISQLDTADRNRTDAAGPSFGKEALQYWIDGSIPQ